MKKAFYLAAVSLGFIAFFSGAKADPVPQEPPINPYIDTDGDGVPLAVADPSLVKPTPTVEDQQKAEALAEADKNWLVRGYEQQVKAHSSNDSTGDQDSDLYYELSKNKDLAKLAGITPFDSGDAAATNQTQDDQSLKKTDSTSTQPETYAESLHHSPVSAFGLKPLISSLGPADSLGLHNFYSSPSLSTSSSLFGSSQPAKTATDTSPLDSAQDTTDLETPGMVAAKNDPLADLNSPDLTLDTLPGETVEQAKAYRMNNNSIDLPSPMGLEQLHSNLPKAQSLQGPLSGTQKTTAPSKPTYNSYPPEPTYQPAQIVPVHGPIADPYDILNH